MQKQIFVFGGCHVTGYLVGEQDSFSAYIEKELRSQSIIAEYKLIDLLAIHKPDKMIKAFEGNVPDLLILQIGNHEMTPSLKYRVRKMFTKYFGVKYKPKPDLNIRPIIAEKIFIPSSSDYIQMLYNFLLFLLTFNQLVEWKQFSKNIISFFNSIPNSDQLKIIVLSPFPTYDPTWNYYRKRGSKIVKEIVGNKGWTFIDLHEKFGPAIERRKLMIDIQHLNRRGHKLVAQEIIEQIITNKMI